MRIKLPRGRELGGKILTAFEQERLRVDNILARKPARVATRSPPPACHCRAKHLTRQSMMNFSKEWPLVSLLDFESNYVCPGQARA
jgi:hypothetical protein